MDGMQFFFGFGKCGRMVSRAAFGESPPRVPRVERQDRLSNRICSGLTDFPGADPLEIFDNAVTPLSLMRKVAFRNRFRTNGWMYGVPPWRCAWGNPYCGFESHSLRQLHLTKHSLPACQRAKNFNKHRY